MQQKLTISLSGIFSVLLFSVFIWMSCKKKTQCTDTTCHNQGQCDNGKCKCLSNFAGTYCDSLLLTGDWTNGVNSCGVFGADTVSNIGVKKVAGDSSKLMIINAAGYGDTAVAQMTPDAFMATYEGHIVVHGGITDTVSGAIAVGTNEVIYSYDISGGLGCQIRFARH